MQLLTPKLVAMADSIASKVCIRNFQVSFVFFMIKVFFNGGGGCLPPPPWFYCVMISGYSVAEVLAAVSF